MNTCTPSRALAVALGLAGLIGLPAGWARADDRPVHAGAPAPSPPMPAPSPEALRSARRLFEEGQTHYSLGEYDQAIASFRQAYEISSAPGLLFDIAQAHRLKGDCRAALEIYRHFVRQVPASPHRGEADDQIHALEADCGSPSVPAALAPPTPPTTSPTPTPSPAPSLQPQPPPTPAIVTPGPTSPPKVRRRLVASLLVAGVAVGLGTGALYLWNGQRYDRWSRENLQLSAPPSPQTSPSAWIARQNANDSLLRSIRSVDLAVAILGGLSAACLVGSAVAGLVPLGPSLQVGSREVQVAWSLTWR